MCSCTASGNIHICPRYGKTYSFRCAIATSVLCLFGYLYLLYDTYHLKSIRSVRRQYRTFWGICPRYFLSAVVHGYMVIYEKWCRRIQTNRWFLSPVMIDTVKIVDDSNNFSLHINYVLNQKHVQIDVFWSTYWSISTSPNSAMLPVPFQI